MTGNTYVWVEEREEYMTKDQIAKKVIISSNLMMLSWLTLSLILIFILKI